MVFSSNASTHCPANRRSDTDHLVLSHFSNAAMLPMAGQVLAKTHPDADIIALSACIVIAQLLWDASIAAGAT